MSSNSAIDSIGPSFWSLKRGRADLMFNDEFDDQAEQQERHFKRQKVAMAKAYGVGYEWITEPPGCVGNGPFWQDRDQEFVGAESDEVGRVERDLAQQKEDTADSGSEERHSEKLKKEEVLNRPLDFQSLTTCPDKLFRDSGLPSPNELEGTYDIIFYAGTMDYVMRHHRTAKGTLTLSIRKNCFADRACLLGTVAMHPDVDVLDVIPFGGNLKFEETERVQRVTQTEWSRKETGKFKDGNLVPCPYEKVESSTTKVNARAVINVKVTDPPNGMPLNRTVGTPCDYRGEIRFFREKIATGIVREQHKYSDEIPSSKHNFEYAGTKAAEDVIWAHYEKSCSWLHNHTILTKTAATKVGDFLCPPPVLFFEKGDICLDLWCGGLEGFTYSQLIARRRVSEESAPVARPLTNEEKHRQEVKKYEEEIQKLEVKKQLACFAFHCQEEISRRSSLQLDFDVKDYCDCKRSMINNAFDVMECVRYMDAVFFNEQLARYNLRLESHKYCSTRISRSHPWDCRYCIRFIFARIKNT